MENIVNDIERIVKDNKERIVEINDRLFVFGNDYKEITDDGFRTANQITFNDLTSFTKILLEEADRQKCKWFVQVKNENNIVAFTELDDKARRHSPYAAAVSDRSFAFGSAQNYEDFIIGLRSKFIDTPERNELIKMISSIKNNDENSMEDNGITQTVTIKKGTMLANQEVKSIVKLKPFRTFIEVDQPESEFLFRIKDGGNYFTLFEADGGKWKIEARKNIVDFLIEKLKENQNIIILS